MLGISAQVSLYPLRQESLSPAIDKAVKTFEEHGIEVTPGAMSTLLVGDAHAVFQALEDVFHQGAETGEIVMVVTLSNTCPV